MQRWRLLLSQMFCQTNETEAKLLFTKQDAVLPLDLVKFRSREIGCQSDYIGLRIDKYFGNKIVEESVKFQRDTTILNAYLKTSRELLIRCLTVYGINVITMTSWWPRWRLKSPASRLFTQSFIQTQIKENIRVTGLCVGNSPGPVNSPHKGPVTRKMFPFDDVIMLCGG